MSKSTEKKPFYKKVWFWIIVVVLVGAIGSQMGGNDDKKAESSSETKTEKKSSKKITTKKEKSEDKNYKVGETAEVDNVSYTLSGVTKTDERNELEDEQPANVIKVTYSVKNNSDDEITVGSDLEVYSSDGKKLESYPNENTMNTIAAGKSIDAVAHFSTDKLGEFELQFSPLASFSDAAIFKANLQ